MSVDGTEFKITEPSPFNPVWFSHKFQGPGLRYELGIAIQTGWICWLAGPFPPGEFNDQEIFKLGLMNYLSPGEKVEVDDGYRGPIPIRPKSDFGGNDEWMKMKAEACARHKTVNRNLKEFGILGSRFHHSRHKHHLVVFAVTAIRQSEILDSRATYQIEYNIRRNQEIAM